MQIFSKRRPGQKIIPAHCDIMEEEELSPEEETPQLGRWTGGAGSNPGSAELNN